MAMAFNFFGFKSSPDKDNESKKSELSSEKIPETTKPLSFDEALARQLQSKAEIAALSEPLQVEPQPQPLPEPKDEIIFEKAPAREEKITSVEAAPSPATATTPVTEMASDTPSPSSQVATFENATQVPTPEQQDGPAQVPLVPATREDVIAAYKIFLDRLPENEEVITPRIGLARERILSSFMTSKYFLSRPKNIQLLLLTAIQIEQKANA
jgi:hypothetical protein